MKRPVSSYPSYICQCIWWLVSLCSPLQARLNALRGFFHTRFVGEISAKYCRTSALEYLLNIWTNSLAQSKGVKLSVGGIQCIYTKGCKANCKINKKWKNDEFHNIAPQIFVNVYGDWFHCVALCELVWMHCVAFFILDLLERYRQNTAEHLHLNT